MDVELVPFHRDQLGIYDTCAQIWNTACGPDLAITPRGMEYFSRPTPGVMSGGRVAKVAGKEVGFILADVLEAPAASRAWVSALAVLPAYQNQQIGKALINWAEGLARLWKPPYLQLGGSPRWLAPGLPAQLQNKAVFEKLGFQFAPDMAWDCARCLKDYQSPARVAQTPGDVHCLRPDEVEELQALLASDFSGGWENDARIYLQEGGPLEDFVVLRSELGLDAFCWLTHSASTRPLDRFYPHGLPRPWGQLGMVGVRESRRGLGFSLKLLDGAVRRLIELGVDGCVIDWTGLLGLYGKLGFRPYRCYYSGGKPLAD